MWMKLESSRHQVAIFGRVTDAQTGRALGGVQVAITTAPTAFTSWLEIKAKQYEERWTTLAERPDRTRTAADGHFHFLDLPTGQYTLTASWPGGGTRHGAAKQTVQLTTNRMRTAADLIVPLTTLKGQITGPDAKQPVFLAEVRVQGSGERTFSDAQGSYLLAGLEIGKRTIMVSARGYTAASQTVELKHSGEEVTLNVGLSKSA